MTPSPDLIFGFALSFGCVIGSILAAVVFNFLNKD